MPGKPNTSKNIWTGTVSTWFQCSGQNCVSRCTRDKMSDVFDVREKWTEYRDERVLTLAVLYWLSLQEADIERD